MSRKNDVKAVDIPDFITDTNTNITYKKGRFLGRGGFAKCFELIEMGTNRVFAGKVIAKAQLQKHEQREKMSQEIAIHRSLKHKHVVEFYSYFEDPSHIYIVLEICNKRSLMEMHKRRKTLTEPEVRYFVRQIALACKYLHDNKVVHRDLKLGNLFINDDMLVKVGDFGLATRVGYNERKLTLCGTPNYIAPEVLLKKGHSFEVDVWSLGCIVYTLLVGKPPFETNDLKDTYRKIRHNDYTIPPHIPHEAMTFINKMLQSDPQKRPNMDQILDDPYMTRSYVPSRVPVSCLTTHPRFDQGRLSLMPSEYPMRSGLNDSPRRALLPRENVREPIVTQNGKPKSAFVDRENGKKPRIMPAFGSGMSSEIPKTDDNKDLFDLYNQLKQVVGCVTQKNLPNMTEEALEPSAMPIFWVSKWVDYTEKYGLGYQLCDKSIGVLFNDLTRVILMADEVSYQFIEKNGEEQFFNSANQPNDKSITKKVTLLKYFKNYMVEHLLQTGQRPPEADEMARLPYLLNWFRTKSAIVFHLSNGTVQINFFADHIKMIFCPFMQAVTVVSDQREFFVYKFDLIQSHGCSNDLYVRLKYATEIVNRLMTTKLARREATS